MTAETRGSALEKFGAGQMKTDCRVRGYDALSKPLDTAVLQPAALYCLANVSSLLSDVWKGSFSAPSETN